MTAEFFNALFADAVSPEARLAIWTRAGKYAGWFSDPTEAAIYAMTEAIDSEVYYGVGLYRPNIAKGRGKAADVVCITALWADIDFGEHHKKNGLPPDEQAARKVLDRIGLRPSLIVHSGHGLQPIWLLKEPVTAADGAARLAQRWGATVLAHARALGYTLDSVWDLSRVLRVPGTVNRKSEPVPVTCEGNGDLRYDLDDIEASLTQVSRTPQSTAHTILDTSVKDNTLTLPTAEAVLDMTRRAERFVENEPSFRRLWGRKRRDLDSASEYDLALANLAIDGGWTVQDAAALLVAWGHRHRGLDEHPEKLRRLDYLQRTIGKALNGRAVRATEKQIEEGMPAPEPGNPDDPRRVAILEAIEKLLEIRVVRWQQRGEDPAEYVLTLDTECQGRNGVEIRFPDAEGLNQHRFGAAVYAKTRFWPRKVKDATWRRLLNHLGMICEFIPDEDDGPAGQVRGWLERYLEERPVMADVDDALDFGRPFYRAGRLHVPAHKMHALINEHHVPRITNRDFTRTLRAAGFTRTTVTPMAKERHGHKIKARRYWRDNRGVAQTEVGATKQPDRGPEGGEDHD